MTEQKKAVRLPNKIEAMLPIVVLLALMIGNYILGWGQDPHIPVLIACAVAMLVGKLCGVSYQEMLTGALDAVSASL
ncbi:MAG: Na+/H+ antiporter NhaC, partial [Firmicutes bacterium]|nr:Na+/H+ antiporter NhaC [Bacillota bacterium]